MSTDGTEGTDQPDQPDQQGGHGIRLTWLGHATVVIDLGGVRLLTDPLLRRHAGPLVRAGSAPDRSAWHDPDAVLLSHLHHDHADLASLRRLGPVPVVTGSANRAWAARRGLTVAQPPRPARSWSPTPTDGADQAADHTADDDADGVDDGWWRVPHATGRGQVRVRLVPAVHESRPMPHRPNATNGFLVRSADATVYFAGDTALHDQMDALVGLAGGVIDVALLPIGGWGPVLSEGHLGPQTAAEAAVRLGARVVMPVHYGTLHPWGWPRPLLGWMQSPLAAFARALHERAPGVVLFTPPIGQATTVPTRPREHGDGPGGSA